MKKSISALVGTTFAAAMILAGAQTASATDAVPTPSAAGGVVTVCADESVNLNATDGSVLPTDEQQQLIDHAAFRCANGDLSHGAMQAGTTSTLQQSKAVTLASSSPTVTAHLTLTVGLARWLATAQHASSVHKKLTCEYRVNYAAWTSCGEADGTQTYLSTRTNSICPPKGEHWEVEAFLREGRVDYFDTASGISK